MNFDAAVAIVVALQFAAFGWRINREISVGDEERRTWLPIADYINILMFLFTAGACVVLPIAIGEFGALSKTILAVAVTFIAFHPITIAGHYCLLTGRGRERYSESMDDYPYYTDEEVIFLAISILCAVAVGWYVYSIA